jgi:Tfp pilus assembly protein PilW
MSKLRTDERGFTVIEILLYAALSLVVIVGPLLYLLTTIRQQNSVSSRAYTARQAEFGLEQMVRDLREAMASDSTGASLNLTVSNPTTSTTAVSFYIPTPGSDTTAQQITWTCPSTGATSAGNCTRTVGSSSRIEIVGVKSATFAPTSASGASMTLTATNPAYLGITLNVQITSQLDSSQSRAVSGVSNPVVVQTGVDLRNFA